MSRDANELEKLEAWLDKSSFKLIRYPKRTDPEQKLMPAKINEQA